MSIHESSSIPLTHTTAASCVTGESSNAATLEVTVYDCGPDLVLYVCVTWGGPLVWIRLISRKLLA